MSASGRDDHGTCADPADDGVGLSAVAFSFDRGKTWIQPRYTGWTASDCNPTATCAAHEGPIHTLPWYYENRLVSSGDPAVAVGPIAVNGRFSWSNGSRVLLRQPHRRVAIGLRVPEPGVPRLPRRWRLAARQPDPSSVLSKSSWKPPVIVNSAYRSDSVRGQGADLGGQCVVQPVLRAGLPL